MPRFIPFFIATLSLLASAQAADLHVSPTGDDTHPGTADKPLKTIARAIRLAQAGDTIHLAKATYFESADLSNKMGTEDKPITLDGHGATLDGSEPVIEAQWEALGDGVYRKVKLMPRMDEAMLARWFFLFDGKMQRMSRCSKGPSQPLKAPNALAPGEWTYVAAEDAFYLRLATGTSLDGAKVRYPQRSSAIVQSIKGAWHIVRNITGTHVYNDGYNVHGEQRHHRYENIAAIECGDDGFSAHEDGDCIIDGFTSIGNATGLCDTGTSRTHYRRVYIRDCDGYDLFFIGLEHSLEDALIESSAARAFWVDGYRLTDGQTCALRMKNVRIVRGSAAPQDIRIGTGSRVRAERCSFEGFNITMTPAATLDLQSCLITGPAEAKPNLLMYGNTIWIGAGNHYDIASLRVDQRSFTQAQFADFQVKYTHSEKGSVWAPLPATPLSSIGADASRLPSAP